MVRNKPVVGHVILDQGWVPDHLGDRLEQFWSDLGPHAVEEPDRVEQRGADLLSQCGVHIDDGVQPRGAEVDDALLVDASAAVARRVGVLVHQVVLVGGVGAVAQVGPRISEGTILIHD